MIFCDEMWNSVDVYGSPAEIERFKATCFDPVPVYRQNCQDSELDEEAIVMVGLVGSRIDTWNFRQRATKSAGHYRFAFDTLMWFPTREFERIAEAFPSLAFDCDCIADNDRSMGFGWYNPPEGGDPFRDDYDVPPNYWNASPNKRDPMAELRYQALVAELKQKFCIR
ncbi:MULTISPECIES: hypothetical protein [Sphingomonas]|uniref:Uncharacterized protein n=1 Tax=Sphingomonas molluscorum TaxID=418184 RepID=A0ABU8Q4Q4_9SPHN|nr:hypothetical protein [Sphingomonas sp. JUb134]MBM7406258.1 hypothetical protein [Sphingomonas sp. JUb134]